MRALQIQSPGQASIIELEDPAPGPGETLVRVEAVASCPHWDITLMAGKDIFDRPGFPRYPIVPGRPGHEMAGVIENVGRGVSEFSPGDKVMAYRAMAENTPGSYAEKVCIPADYLLLRPEGFSAAETASFEMAMCVATCFLALPDLSGQRVSVGGLGPAGLIAVQLAKAAGAARVIGFDLLPERHELARGLGADETVDPQSPEAARFTDNPGSEVDYAIDCSGSAASVHYQMEVAGKGVALFGVQHEPYHYQPRHWLAGLSLYAPAGHSRQAAMYAAEQLASGALQLSPLNSVELPLSQFAEGTRLLADRRAIKVLYRP